MRCGKRGISFIMLTRNKFRKVSIISIFVVTVLLLAVFFVYSFLIREDFMVFKVSNITNLYEKVKKAEKDTGNLELGEEDVNAVIQNYAKKLGEYKKVKILGLYSSLENSKLIIYVPIRYGMIKTILSSSGDIKFEDDKVIYTPSSFKVGKIAITKDFVLSKIKSLSSEEIAVSSNEIFISKDILPFDVVSLSLIDSKIIAQIQKVALNDSAGTTNEISTPNSTDKKVTATTKQDILKRASRQLNGVKNDVKSTEGKQIISKIQTVVNKMISDPNYNYKSESDEIKSQYSQLPAGDRDNIKEAILNNMDTSTMRQIRTTFGL